MPTIEVLPSSSTSSGPNWTYSNLPPALAHRNSLPTASSRVRATRTNNTENSAARQRQINSRILELERGDNYRDIHIPVPARKGAASGSRCKPSPPLLSTLAFFLFLFYSLGVQLTPLASTRTKASSTQNVRRVLASQKTFANHLADAEALHTVAAAAATVPARDEDGEEAWSEEEPGPGPVLGYGACAAAESTRPKRTFCEICGYWGRYRCQKCAARYCGLECGGVHSETRCNKFYA